MKANVNESSVDRKCRNQSSINTLNKIVQNILLKFETLAISSFNFDFCTAKGIGSEVENYFKFELKTSILYSPKKDVSKAKKRFVIIIVDDEYIIRNSMKRLFTSVLNDYYNLEIVLIEANDGLECIFSVYLATLHQLQIDFVITDQNMNYMNGSCAAKIIKNLVQDKKIIDFPIFMSSAIGNNYENNLSCIKKVYIKPLDKNNLKEILDIC